MRRELGEVLSDIAKWQLANDWDIGFVAMWAIWEVFMSTGKHLS